uniref:Uncharacterized protein n=1 Tax=uncultured marine group II/III euryarchaeote KM3_57_F04 TaxID=1456465 RepID=A0A075H8V6_9EURY|nr:hypothetical protein [uncultured marine group II/III euryarchaeote KM3_57_F04]
MDGNGRYICLLLVLVMLGGVGAGCLGIGDDDVPHDDSGDGPPVSDADMDGIVDGADLCVDTPTNETADSDGCSASQRDADGDGVFDADDLCPGTPAGTPVKADGCESEVEDDDDSEFDYGNWLQPAAVPDKYTMFNSDDGWESVAANIDALSFPIAKIKDNRNNDVSAIINFTDAHDIELVVVGGGTLGIQTNCDDTNGEESARRELIKLQHIYDLGGEVDYLSLDGPISRVIDKGRNGNCGFTLNQSIEELVDYMQAIHAEHPDIRIGWLPNLPNWAYGDYTRYHCNREGWSDHTFDYVLEELFTALAQVNESFAYVLVDHPWGYASATHIADCNYDVTTVDWVQRLIDLEMQVKNHSLPFGLIYNSELGGVSSNAEFHNESLAYITAYQNHGGSPDVRMINSWYTYPTENLPESEPYTLTNTMLAALAILENGTNGNGTNGNGTNGTADEFHFANWMHPNSAGNKAAMFNETEQWDETLAGIDAFGFFIAEVANVRTNLTPIVDVLRANDIAIAVEGGGTLNFAGCNDQNGEQSAIRELAKIQRVYDAGGQVDYFTMDGPISRVIAGGRDNNCGFTLNQSIEELVDYMQTMHATYPDIGIGLLVNFPNWAYGGIEAYQCNNTNWGNGIDYHDVLEAAITAVEAAGEEFAYFIADNPWGYASGTHNSVCSHDVSEIDWLGQILALENQVKGHGIPFGLTYNSELGGNSDNASFHNETLAFILAYQAYGGSPDIRNIESWYPYPTENRPEEEPYTFSNLMLAAIAILESDE